MEKKICCFGEVLLRLSPAEDWLQTNTMPFFVGGAELNAATALANWGMGVKYITAIPDNYLSKQITDNIGQKKIDTAAIVFSGNRIGCYFLPIGSELKNAGVIYDRDYSAFAGLKTGVINWDEVLEDCNWFHFSAISPALNADLAAVCMEALEAASAKGLTISVDLNYRNKLWQYHQQPVEVMPALIKFCDVVMGNIWAVESLLGIQSPIESSEGKTQQELESAASKSIAALQATYPKATTIAFTFRLQKKYMAVIQHHQIMAVSKQFNIDTVVDKVGSGDCFMAGLIYGVHNNHNPQNSIDFAAAAAVGKLQEAGDATQQTIQEINNRAAQ